MVLHTDEPHPHVHVVVKAVSEEGERLNIRKETLRRWRQGFARQLRARGVEANATDRRVRGQSRPPKSDSIFRAARRGESSHMTARVYGVVRELTAGSLDQSGAARLQRTRLEIVKGWLGVRNLLVTDGEHQLADQVLRFVRQMPPPHTEKQWLAADLIERARESRTKDKPLVRCCVRGREAAALSFWLRLAGGNACFFDDHTTLRGARLAEGENPVGELVIFGVEIGRRQPEHLRQLFDQSKRRIVNSQLILAEPLRRSLRADACPSAEFTLRQFHAQPGFLDPLAYD